MGIHFKLAKRLNKKLNLDNDLFTFGNLIPDVDSDSLYARKDAHYYTGIRFEKCPNKLEINLENFLKDYKDKLNIFYNSMSSSFGLASIIPYLLNLKPIIFE